MRRDPSADALLILTVLLWSGTYAASKFGVGATTPFVFVIVRYTLGGSATVLAMLAREGVPRFQRRDLGLLVAAAICGVSINQGGYVLALATTSASNVALLLGTIPIWTALFAVVSGQERLDSAHWIGVAGGIVGVTLIIAGGSGGGVGDISLASAALVLAAAAGWGAYSVLIRPLMGRYPALQISSFAIVVGMLVLIPISLPDLLRQDWGAISPIAWIAIAYTGVIAVAVTNVLYFTAVHKVGAARASMYGYLTPFLGVLMAVILLGERVNPIQILGGVIVVAAVAIGRRNAAVATEPAG